MDKCSRTASPGIMLNLCSLPITVKSEIQKRDAKALDLQRKLVFIEANDLCVGALVVALVIVLLAVPYIPSCGKANMKR